MSSAKEEVARRAPGRRDPRVDPDSVPGMPAVHEEPEKAPKALGGDEVALRAHKLDPRAEPESLPGARLAAAQVAADGDAVDVDTGSADEPAAAAPAPGDARLAELEPLFDRSAWKEIAEKLGPPEKAAELPPPLALIYALARREAAGDDVARGATELAISSMASLLGVAPGSATALVLAKRLLRQNPASWSTRPAPPARLSLAIVLIGVAIGVAAGSFLSLETFRSLKLF